jgi:DNA-directed RNA polymerase subunit H (RpoH/RPB5)
MSAVSGGRASPHSISPVQSARNDGGDRGSPRFGIGFSTGRVNTMPEERQLFTAQPKCNSSIEMQTLPDEMEYRDNFIERNLYEEIERAENQISKTTPRVINKLDFSATIKSPYEVMHENYSDSTQGNTLQINVRSQRSTELNFTMGGSGVDHKSGSVSTQNFPDKGVYQVMQDNYPDSSMGSYMEIGVQSENSKAFHQSGGAIGNPKPHFEKNNCGSLVGKLNFGATNKSAYEIMEDQYKGDSSQGSLLQVAVESGGGPEAGEIDHGLVFEGVARNLYDDMQKKYLEDESQGSLLEIAIMDEKLVFENVECNTYEIVEENHFEETHHESSLEVAVIDQNLASENVECNTYEIVEENHFEETHHESSLEVAVIDQNLAFENVECNTYEIVEENHFEETHHESSLEVAVLPEELMEEVTNQMTVKPPKVPRINIDTPRKVSASSQDLQESPYDRFEASLQAQRLNPGPTQVRQAAHEHKFGYHHQATMPTTYDITFEELPDQLSNRSLPAPCDDPDNLPQLYYRLQEESPDHRKEVSPAQEAYFDFQKNLWGADSKRVTGNQLAAFHPKSLNSDEFYTCIGSEMVATDSRRPVSPGVMEPIPDSEKMIRGSGSVKDMKSPFRDDRGTPVYQQDWETEELNNGKARLRSNSHRVGDSPYESNQENVGSNGRNLLGSPMVGIDNFISFSNDGARIQTSNHEFVVFETEKNLTDSKRLESIGSMEKKHEPTLYSERPQSLDSKFS